MKSGSGLLLLLACLALAEGGLLLERHRIAAKLEIEQPPGQVSLDSLQKNFMKGIDTDKDGKISFPEFQLFMKAISSMASKQKPPPKELLQMMFIGMDKDNDKFVSMEEFKAFKIPNLSPAAPPKAGGGMGGGAPPMPPMPPMPALGGVGPAGGLPPVAPASGFFGGAMPRPSAGLKCVAWRKTTTCIPSGPRDPLQDKDCLTIIGGQESGFCECEGFVHTAAVPCGHDPVDCTKECGLMQKLHRETFGAAGSNGNGPNGNGGPPAPFGSSTAAIGNSKNPYSQALRSGQKAMNDVANAVDNSNQLLGSTRNMISKMMDLKPWKEIQKMGKDAEEAGRKTEMLAKLARPFIYTQVDEQSK